MKRDRNQKVSKPNDSEDEQYNEAEDGDYNPEQTAFDEDVSSSEHESIPATKPGKRKAEDDDELDSGDEVTIKERRSKKRRKHELDGSEGEEGRIKTRSQRLAEKLDRRQQKKATDGKITVDVNELWDQLSSLPVGKPPMIEPSTYQIGEQEAQASSTLPTSQLSEHINITRRIKFAGQITEVEEEVLRNSEEAQRYLAEQEQLESEEPRSGTHNALHKPLRRMSQFEPNPLGIVKGLVPEKQHQRVPSRMDLAMAEKRAEDDRKKKAEKLSTMQKTALDWKGFVIEQGLGEELNDYGKSKKGFLAREEFLDKVHGSTEVARRTARLKA